jgi:hypothetical protein
MKHITSFVGLLVFAVLFSSCEKVIHVDLNERDAQYVIAAELYEGEHPFQLSLRKTTDYYGESPQESIDNALVWLYEVNSDSILVPSMGNGRYELPFHAEENKSYRIKVLVDGKAFTAETKMPQKVKIDSLNVIKAEANPKDSNFQLSVAFIDPAIVKNNYRLVIAVNDSMQNKPEDLILFNDRLSDGKHANYLLERQFKRGDRVRVQLVTMDDGMYDYLVSLKDVIENQDGPAPANPISNLRGGALGYFGAFNSSMASTKIN